MEPLGQSGFLRQGKDGSLCIETKPLSEDFDVDNKPFARGKFATVRRCRHRASGREFAAKCMRKRRRIDVRHEIVHEALVLQSTAKCSQIVSLHHVYETPTEIYLLMEMVSGGELQRVLDDEDLIPERQAARLMKQILEALVHLHDKNIAHLDLKPQNVLLTDHFPDCKLKLCDFGISRLIEAGVEIREINGTPDYVAPEVLQYEPIGLATDMWSVGVLAYVLLSGHTPFGGDSKQETFCNITEGHLDFPAYLFASISQHAQAFIKSLLKMDPRERPTARVCLEHPWLRETQDVSLVLSPTEEPVAPTYQVDTSSLEEPVEEQTVRTDQVTLTLPAIRIEEEAHACPLIPVEELAVKAVVKEESRERRIPVLVETDSKMVLSHSAIRHHERLSTLNKAVSEMERMVSEVDKRASMVSSSSEMRRQERLATLNRAMSEMESMVSEVDKRAVSSPLGIRRQEKLSTTLNKAMSEMESMVSELKEGLAMTKRLIFTEEILQVDERVGIVY